MSGEGLPVFDEAWRVGRSSESKRTVARLVKQSRRRKPPEGLSSGEDYRAWLLKVIDNLATNDVTEQEHEETAAWRAQVEAAAAAELWAEYQPVNGTTDGTR